ncbi:hypothetical protein ACJ6UI_20960, partial [Escherichia coli]
SSKTFGGVAQEGSSNRAKIDQTGDYNLAYIDQAGSATSVSTSGASILEAAVRCAINKKSGVSSCLMKSIVFMVIHYC